MRRGLLIVVVLAALFGALAWRARGDGDDLPPDVGVVEFVVDGDTIDVAIGGRTARVRLIGIDTPELHVEDGPPECFATEAAEYTRQLLPVGTEVRLERDVVGTDDYGRVLAYVYRRDHRWLVNERIVASGYAQPLSIAPNDAYAADFAAAAVAARGGGLGLWAACAGQ